MQYPALRWVCKAEPMDGQFNGKYLKIDFVNYLCHHLFYYTFLSKNREIVDIRIPGSFLTQFTDKIMALVLRCWSRRNHICGWMLF
jgi:hypothetical protein